MPDFVLISLAAARAPAPRPPWLAGLVDRPPPGWSGREIGRGAWLFLPDLRPMEVRRIGQDDIILGETHAMDGSAVFDPGDIPDLDAEAASRRLACDAWGAYVHVRHAPRSGEVSVFRDPSGALEALVWRRDGATLVASSLPAWLDAGLPEDLALDWERVAAFAVNPTLQTAGPALAGVDAVAPGQLWAGGRAVQIWRPAGLVGRRGPGRDRGDRALVATVDQVIAGLGRGRLLIEVSGGLDSAIVATGLASLGGQIACALNYHVRDRQGDERSFAREVALGVGVVLTEAEKAERPLDLEALGAISGGPRPALNGFDHPHDADVAARCAALGVDVILTGQGGDNVFFQTPTSLIAADGLLNGLTASAALKLARWQGRSVYRLVGEAVAARLRPAGGMGGRPGVHLTARALEAGRAAAPHPWLADFEQVPPAKRLQIASLANAQIVHGVSRRGQAARLCHPLLAQPVVELCLGIPALELTRGGRDRGLARDAFAHRLPASVAERSTKGRLSAYYGRVLALSLAELRPLLLDGRLAQRGLIDQAGLDPMLSVEHLLWRGGYGALVNLIMLELWVRAWEARIDALRRATAV